MDARAESKIWVHSWEWRAKCPLRWKQAVVKDAREALSSHRARLQKLPEVELIWEDFPKERLSKAS